VPREALSVNEIRIYEFSSAYKAEKFYTESTADLLQCSKNVPVLAIQP